MTRENLFMQTSFGLVAKMGQIRFIAMCLQNLINDAVFFLPDIGFSISYLGCFKNNV